MINDEYIELKENYECKVLRYIFIGMILSVFLLSYYFRREVIGDIAAINIIFMGLLSIYLLFNEVLIDLFGEKVNQETYEFSKVYFFWITLGVVFYMFG